MDNLNHSKFEGTTTNFFLFFLAIFMSLLNNNLSTVICYVMNFKNKLTKSTYYCELKSQLKNLQKECSEIDMTDEFAKYARLQRKIIKIQDELKKEVSAEKEENMKKKMIFRVVVGLVCIVTISTFNAYPVVQVSPEWFYPISSILCWPGVEPGCISFLVWCTVSNTVIRTFS